MEALRRSLANTSKCTTLVKSHLLSVTQKHSSLYTPSLQGQGKLITLHPFTSRARTNYHFTPFHSKGKENSSCYTPSLQGQGKYHFTSFHSKGKDKLSLYTLLFEGNWNSSLTYFHSKGKENSLLYILSLQRQGQIITLHPFTQRTLKLITLHSLSLKWQGKIITLHPSTLSVIEIHLFTSLHPKSKENSSLYAFALQEQIITRYCINIPQFAWFSIWFIFAIFKRPIWKLYWNVCKLLYWL